MKSLLTKALNTLALWIYTRGAAEYYRRNLLTVNVYWGDTTTDSMNTAQDELN